MGDLAFMLAEVFFKLNFTVVRIEQEGLSLCRTLAHALRNHLRHVTSFAASRQRIDEVTWRKVRLMRQRACLKVFASTMSKLQCQVISLFCNILIFYGPNRRAFPCIDGLDAGSLFEFV